MAMNAYARAAYDRARTRPADTEVKPRPLTEPLIEHLAPLSGGSPVDLGPRVQARLGGAFSLMCTVKMDSVADWGRVFDFSRHPDFDSITAGAIGNSKDLHFTVFRGAQPAGVRVDGFFDLGKEATALFTVSPSGHMKVFKDGMLVGENPHGHAPAPTERPRMVLGGHFHFKNQAFHGRLASVKVWDQEISWPAAEEADSKEPGAPSSASTAASSDKNSVAGDWDAGSGSEG